MSDLKITDGDDTIEFQLDAALAREAALREELAEVSEANRLLVAWREDAAKEALSAAEDLSDLTAKLTAAEQRNTIMTECLERLRGCSQLRPTPSLLELIDSVLEAHDAKD